MHKKRLIIGHVRDRFIIHHVREQAQADKEKDKGRQDHQQLTWIHRDLAALAYNHTTIFDLY